MAAAAAAVSAHGKGHSKRGVQIFDPPALAAARAATSSSKLGIQNTTLSTLGAGGGSVDPSPDVLDPDDPNSPKPPPPTLAEACKMCSPGAIYDALLRPVLIDPRTSRLLGPWDGVTTIALLFTTFITPVEVSLPNMEVPGLYEANRGVDVVFLTDLVLQFIMIYLPAGSQDWEAQPTKIAKHYIHGWFPLDTISNLASLLDIGQKSGWCAPPHRSYLRSVSLGRARTMRTSLTRAVARAPTHAQVWHRPEQGARAAASGATDQARASRQAAQADQTLGGSGVDPLFGHLSLQIDHWHLRLLPLDGVCVGLADRLHRTGPNRNMDRRLRLVLG